METVKKFFPFGIAGICLAAILLTFYLSTKVGQIYAHSINILSVVLIPTLLIIFLLSIIFGLRSMRASRKVEVPLVNHH
jgi:membrane protein DedA with SNARE-associated domain